MKTLSFKMAFLLILGLGSCSKTETTPPSAGETNAILLAGPKGSSKTWNLTSATVSVNGASPQAVTNIPSCETDNIFQFTYNSTQDYQETEGATLCTSTDPSTVEKGSWAFTDDGKSLLIDAVYYPISTQFQSEQDLALYILAQGEPLTVTQITTSSFTLNYPYIDTTTTPSTNYSFTITFTKI